MWEVTGIFNIIKRGKRLEIHDFVTHRARFYWVIKRKPNIHVLMLGGGPCNFQTCFRGGSVIFVPKGRGGLCVFYQPHFQILHPHPPLPPPTLIGQPLKCVWRVTCNYKLEVHPKTKNWIHCTWDAIKWYRLITSFCSSHSSNFNRSACNLKHN